MSEKQTIGGTASEPVSSTGNKAVKKPVIRTMQKDIDFLRGRSSIKSPQNLPVMEESVKKDETKIKKDKKLAQKKKESSLIQRIVSGFASIFKKSEKTRQKEEERKKAKEFKIAEKRKEAEKKRIKKEQEKLEKKRIAEEQKIVEEKKSLKEGIEKKSETPIAVLEKGVDGLPKLVVLILIIVLIFGGAGGFVYWWNYIRVIIPPVAKTHYQCQNFQCISVEGEEADQCQSEQDCQPTEPEIPQSLVLTSETEIIEIEIESNGLFAQELELVLTKSKKEKTIDNILIKVISQTEKKYASLDDFVSFLKISLPNEIIQSLVADELGGANYTFFSYNQAEGKRLGFIVKLMEGTDLSEILRDWENSAQEDLKALFWNLNEDILLLAATEEFQDNIYKDIAIRYINFPNPDLSIDYAVVGDKLVIATSRESTYAIIDTLLLVETEATTTNTSEVNVLDE